MGKHRVYQAEPFRFGVLRSTGDASYMLLRQHQFPDRWNFLRGIPTDELESWLRVGHHLADNPDAMANLP